MTDEQTLGETILEIMTLMVIALVLALMIMAAFNVHFRRPERRAKDPKPHVVHVATAKNHQNHPKS